ncbi:hypothetical protein L1887_60190 [Cichorium endivia]|nr:hypothetical protein L1887_60190 [Cichorium endivia]
MLEVGAVVEEEGGTVADDRLVGDACERVERDEVAVDLGVGGGLLLVGHGVIANVSCTASSAVKDDELRHVLGVKAAGRVGVGAVALGQLAGGGVAAVTRRRGTSAARHGLPFTTRLLELALLQRATSGGVQIRAVCSCEAGTGEREQRRDERRLHREKRRCARGTSGGGFDRGVVWALASSELQPATAASVCEPAFASAAVARHSRNAIFKKVLVLASCTEFRMRIQPGNRPCAKPTAHPLTPARGSVPIACRRAHPPVVLLSFPSSCRDFRRFLGMRGAC